MCACVFTCVCMCSVIRNVPVTLGRTGRYMSQRRAASTSLVLALWRLFVFTICFVRSSNLPRWKSYTTKKISIYLLINIYMRFFFSSTFSTGLLLADTAKDQEELQSEDSLRTSRCFEKGWVYHLFTIFLFKFILHRIFWKKKIIMYYQALKVSIHSARRWSILGCNDHFFILMCVSFFILACVSETCFKFKIENNWNASFPEIEKNFFFK